MTIDDLKPVWRGQSAAGSELKTMAAAIQRSQKTWATLLGIFACNTVLAIAVSFYAMVQHPEGLAPLLVLQGVLFMALALLVRRRRFVTSASLAGINSVADTARVALKIVERELQHQRLLLWFGCGVLVCLGFAIISLL